MTDGYGQRGGIQEHDPKSVAKSEIEILSQWIDAEDGTYRVRDGKRVHYLTISTDIFDEDTMCRPYLLIPSLPDLPDGPWTTMRVSREKDGLVKSTILYSPLPEIQTAWHDQHIDVLSLKPVKFLQPGIQETLYQEQPAIAKVANFAWDVPRIENETWAYSIISQHEHENPDEPSIAPKFIGHLTECGRVMGILMEKVEGFFPSSNDLLKCQVLVSKLHKIGLTHGDVNRYNFILDPTKDGQGRLIDFEHAKEFDEEEACLELQSLQSELAETTGRGGISQR